MQYIIKFLGLALITAATTCLGFGYTANLKERISTLYWYKRAINILSEKIRFSSAELTKILCEIPLCNKYFSLTAPFSVILNDSGLNEGDKKLIYEFFEQIGMGDTEQQMKICALYESELNFRLNDAEKEYNDKSKIIKSLGFFAGLGIAIILI